MRLSHQSSRFSAPTWQGSRRTDLCHLCVCVCMYVTATEGPSHSLCIWQGCSGSFELHKSSWFLIHLRAPWAFQLRSVDRTNMLCWLTERVHVKNTVMHVLGYMHFKGIVHPNMNTVSLFYHVVLSHKSKVAQYCMTHALYIIFFPKPEFCD